MKNLITGIACLSLLLAMILQFSYNQALFSRIMKIDREADLLRDVVKQEGCLSEEREMESREALKELLHCSDEEIELRGNRQPAEKGEILWYSLRVTTENPLLAAFFRKDGGTEKGEDYEAKRYVVSEYSGEGD